MQSNAEPLARRQYLVSSEQLQKIEAIANQSSCSAAEVVRRAIDAPPAEIERDEFSVSAVEEKFAYRAHGVSLVLQVDRIDRLADGTLCIIDYKTGNAGHFVDRGGELRDVQLVLYADAMDGDVGGLANLVLDPRRIEYKGAGPAWDGSEPDAWRETLGGWKSAVRECLRQLAAGDVRIHTGRTARDRRPYAILSRVEELRRV